MSRAIMNIVVRNFMGREPKIGQPDINKNLFQTVVVGFTNVFSRSLVSKLLWIILLSAISSSGFASINMGSAGDVASSDMFQDHSASSKRDAYTGWAISMDNDILVPSSRDQDYTFGSSLTVMSNSVDSPLFLLDKPLGWLNRKLGVSTSAQKAINNRFELGLYGFTPENISAENTDHSDRPYASIVYWSNTQELATQSYNSIWRSTLTMGLLGLSLVGDIQNEVHRITGSTQPSGWDQQISAGGELTARYSIARQTLWDTDNPNVELKTTAQASVGYITEAGLGVSLRMGNIQSRWQSYNPDLTSYGELSNQPTDSKARVERYISVGFAVKARAYNAFLQGQFRSSEIEYSHNELNHGVVEAWAGYTHSLSNNFRLAYLLRAHTSEVKRGKGNRNVVWGGLTLSKMHAI